MMQSHRKRKMPFFCSYFGFLKRMCRVSVRNSFVAYLKANFSLIGSSYVKLFGKAEVDVNLSLGQFVKVNELSPC